MHSVDPAAGTDKPAGHGLHVALPGSQARWHMMTASNIGTCRYQMRRSQLDMGGSHTVEADLVLNRLNHTVHRKWHQPRADSRLVYCKACTHSLWVCLGRWTDNRVYTERSHSRSFLVYRAYMPLLKMSL